MGLNQISCVKKGGNTGVPKCFLDIKYLFGMFILPVDKVYDATQTLTAEALIAALEADTLDLAEDRVYPIGNFTGFVDSSTDATKETLQYGSESVTNDGKYKWAYSYKKGGVCLNKALRKFNGGSYAVLFYDINGVLYGWKDGDNFRGIPLESLYIPKLKINDYATSTVYSIEMVHDPIYLNDNIGFVEGSVTAWQGITGINDVALSGTRAAAVVTAKAKTGCSATDLYDLYATELAAAAAWKATNPITGNDIGITSVAAVPNSKSWAITLTAADPDYVTTGVVISLASPAVLDGLNVSKYESNTFTVAV